MMAAEKALLAAQLCHRKYMGERYVEVFQCSGDEMNLALMSGARNKATIQTQQGKIVEVKVTWLWLPSLMKRAYMKVCHWLRVLRRAYLRAHPHCLTFMMVVNFMCNSSIVAIALHFNTLMFQQPHVLKKKKKPDDLHARVRVKIMKIHEGCQNIGCNPFFIDKSW